MYTKSHALNQGTTTSFVCVCVCVQGGSAIAHVHGPVKALWCGAHQIEILLPHTWCVVQVLLFQYALLRVAMAIQHEYTA